MQEFFSEFFSFALALAGMILTYLAKRDVNRDEKSDTAHNQQSKEK